MKRKVLFILFISGLVAMTWAQGWGHGKPSDGSRRPAREAVTVSGSLVVSHGSPALKSGDDTYLLGGINRLTGFVDGLKEGAQVTVEGTSITSKRDTTLKFLRPATLTLNGKSYDLSSAASAFGFNRQFGHHPGTLRQFNAPGSNRYQGPDAPSPQWKHQRQQMEPRDNWR